MAVDLKGGHEKGVLVLAVYAPQPKSGRAARLDFWERRREELRRLRRRKRFRGWRVIIVGDFNLHFPG